MLAFQRHTPELRDQNAELVRETLLVNALPSAQAIPDQSLPIQECVEKYAQDLAQMAGEGDISDKVLHICFFLSLSTIAA